MERAVITRRRLIALGNVSLPHRPARLSRGTYRPPSPLPSRPMSWSSASASIVSPGSSPAQVSLPAVSLPAPTPAVSPAAAAPTAPASAGRACARGAPCTGVRPARRADRARARPSHQRRAVRRQRVRAFGHRRGHPSLERPRQSCPATAPRVRSRARAGSPPASTTIVSRASPATVRARAGSDQRRCWNPHGISATAHPRAVRELVQRPSARGSDDVRRRRPSPSPSARPPPAPRREPPRRSRSRRR